MFKNLPSLLHFQPKFFVGGPARFYLALFYDLVALARPKSIVTLGFGDGEAFFTLCQAVRENRLDCQCVAIFRGDESDWNHDPAGRAGEKYCDEFYGDFARLRREDSRAEFAEESVDLLLINDLDAGAAIGRELSAWQSKLSAQAIVAVHGIELERADSPKTAWRNWMAGRPNEEFSEGIGLGVGLRSQRLRAPESFFEQLLISKTTAAELAEIYRLAAARIEAQAGRKMAERDKFASEARKVWMQSLLEDRWKAQLVMDAQAKQLRSLEKAYQKIAELKSLIKMAKAACRKKGRCFDIRKEPKPKRTVAERVAREFARTKRRARRVLRGLMDAQARQLQRLEKAYQKIADLKSLTKVAKAACRKKERCFDIRKEPKPKRTVAERVAREFARTKRRARRVLRRLERGGIRAEKSKRPEDRYKNWIAEHEPIPEQLERQRRESGAWEDRPKISLLIPVFNTPANFLDELVQSLVAQTYENWEACIIDGGSTEQATRNALRRWQNSDPRIHSERLGQNLGVSENTNRALCNATGDFIALVDHDDRLPPFALYELAAAIRREAGAEIFYSDEDRLSEGGVRGKPFFKPEWSPELLFSFMYIGHLTAYRRAFALELGGFRKEFDLSQDYDFALRATERAKKIVHIPHVLYHWREHPASGSGGGKPEARKTNLAALSAALGRRGLPAEIIEYPTANRARLKISDWPKVSIVIPTDSAERAQLCIEQLPRMTSYRDCEIVIVTNSALARVLEVAAPSQPSFRFVHYNKPFNFSEKCNLGASAATGTHLIFFNDDVESGQRDWIENLIEPLENPEVGAVAPKLLYATGKIQHAGLVTGVRGLVGTAMHQWPADSTDYTNFAQSMRAVSALSAACLAMRREDFFRVGEFDAVNTPVAHSDLDLCFKIREAGMRCVYTPFVSMKHRGHASIGVVVEADQISPRSKPSVFLLKRWAGYTCHDPYFPENMRDWLYADSPTPIKMWGRNAPATTVSKADVLFVSHDLSWSGAPLILFQIAKWCKEAGFFVTAMSPKDGPLHEKFREAGIPLLVDPLVVTGHRSFTAFAQEFDCVIASTIFGAPVIRAAKSADIPHLWWIHEGRVGENYLSKDSALREALSMADLIVTPDMRSSQVYQPFIDRPVRVLSYGIPDPSAKVQPAPRSETKPIEFLLLGTIEYRKGQQLLLEALRKLSDEVFQKARFRIVGRAHDPAITEEIKRATQKSSYLNYEEGVSPDAALALIRDTDVMLCASWDETGPLILMEALALGKPILSSNVGAVAEYLSPEAEGLFFPPGDADALARGIVRMTFEPELRDRLSRNARCCYEKYFSFENFAENFVNLLMEAISSRKRRRAADEARAA
jgi:O-antigen biosynthesis protein